MQCKQAELRAKSEHRSTSGVISNTLTEVAYFGTLCDLAGLNMCHVLGIFVAELAHRSRPARNNALLTFGMMFETHVMANKQIIISNPNSWKYPGKHHSI